MCGSATLRAGRKDSGPLPAGAGRGWRGRGTVEDAHVPSCCAAGDPPAARGSPHIRVPGDTQLLLRRPSPPRGTNTKLPATATPLPSDGSYLRPSWVRLRGASLRPPNRSADAPRRRRWPPRSLRVTQFPLGPRQLGVGQRQAGVHTQRRRGGRPRVRASAGGRLTGRRQRPLLVAACHRGHLRPHTHFGACSKDKSACCQIIQLSSTPASPIVEEEN